jgi:precorrin-6B methylase 1
MAKNKPTPKQIAKELTTMARDFEHLRNAIWENMLYAAARRLGVEPADIEEEFAALT